MALESTKFGLATLAAVGLFAYKCDREVEESGNYRETCQAILNGENPNGKLPENSIPSIRTESWRSEIRQQFNVPLASITRDTDQEWAAQRCSEKLGEEVTVKQVRAAVEKLADKN